MSDNKKEEIQIIKNEMKSVTDSLSESLNLIKYIEDSMKNPGKYGKEDIEKTAKNLKEIIEKAQKHYEKIKNITDNN